MSSHTRSAAPAARLVMLGYGRTCRVHVASRRAGVVFLFVLTAIYPCDTAARGGRIWRSYLFSHFVNLLGRFCDGDVGDAGDERRENHLAHVAQHNHNHKWCVKKKYVANFIYQPVPDTLWGHGKVQYAVRF